MKLIEKMDSPEILYKSNCTEKQIVPKLSVREQLDAATVPFNSKGKKLNVIKNSSRQCNYTTEFYDLAGFLCVYALHDSIPFLF